MTSPHYVAERFVRKSDIEIAYDSFGNKEHSAIILIMGLATQMIFWDIKFCEALASKGYWVIRFDNRDVGKSTWRDDLAPPSHFKLLASVIFSRTLNAPYSLSDMADDTLVLMDELQIKKAHIVGASMGGMIAQLFAINFPERVKSLTSIMSTTGDRELPKPKLTFMKTLFKRPPVKADEFIPFGLALWQSLNGSTYTFQKEKISKLLALSLSRGVSQKSNTRQLAAILSSEDRTEALKTLDIPSLVIHGDSDPLIPVACGYATARAIPNAKIKVYPGMGHTLPDELLTDVADDILGLIRTAE